MKKTHYLFLLLFLIPFLGKAQNWKPLGPDDFNQPGAGNIQTASISDGTNNLYIASVYSNNKITIKKFVNGKWQTVSDAAFSENSTSHAKIVFNGTTTYVAYGDQSNSTKLTVKKYNGTNWELVGAAGFSGDYLQAVDLAFNGVDPYVVYTDGASSRKLIVKQYNGTDWVAVGSSDVSAEGADKPSIALDGTTPYVVYNDESDNGNIRVKKFDGSNWVALGDIGSSYVDIYGFVINSGMPYVLYGGWNNSNKLTVQKFNGTNWEWVGTDVFTGEIKGSKISFDGTTPSVIYKTDDYMNPKAVVKKLKADASGWETVGDLGLLEGNSMGGGPGAQDPMAISFINAVPFAFYLEGDYDKKVIVKQFNGTDWLNLGGSGFSAGKAGLLSVASDGIFPYVAYRDGANGNKATVKKYNGAIWETVGSEGFSAGNVSGNMTLSFDAVSTPYLAYGDGASGGKLTVQRYTGSSWETLGSSSVSSGYTDKNMLAFNGNIPYVVYTDENDRISVKKFNSATNIWEIVGSPGFSETFSSYPSIAFNEGVPYVAYLEGGSIHRITVKKLNGNTWEVVGNTDFTQSQSYDSQIAFDNGKAYIIFTDGGNGNKVTVRIYNADTNKWELVGSVVSSAGAGYPKLIFVDHTPYVAYADNSNSGKLAVKKFNGNDWETVGNPNVSAGQVGHIGITGIEGKLVAVYTASDKAYAKSFSLLSATPDANNILYVNKTVIGGDQSGNSWSNAITELADALRWAKENETTWTVSNPLKIYVAKGKYLPKYSPADNNLGFDDGRRNSFLLVKNVQLYGGFDPANGINSLSDARLIAKIGEVSNAGTVLSGDIANDDVIIGSGSTLKFQNNQENNHHVVFSVGDVGNALLDGFTIANGNANINLTGITINGTSIGSYHYGAGIFIDGSSSLKLRNLTVYANAVDLSNGRGGGISNRSGSLVLENLTIVKNLAYIASGIYNVDLASPTFTNGSISGNKSVSHAGGMYNASSSSPTLTNIQIFGNSAGERGGAIYNKSSCNPLLTNITVFGNKANDGGGIYNETSSSPTVRNSIFYGNTKTNGTTINSVTNHQSNGTPPKFSYSLIEGSGGSGNWNVATGTDGGHNLDADVMFTDAANADFTLKTGSPAINAGSDLFYATGQTPNLSGITTDLAGKPRFNGTVDMGAYEYEGTLPVTLVNFTAKAETNGARLTWQTATEQSNKSFNISRSTDGVNFIAIGTVNSKGNSNSLNNYTFLDLSPAAGTNYYRLQQTDTDGKINNLGVRSVEFKLATDVIWVYPNPTADLANIKFIAGTFNSATLLDLTGKVLAQQVLNAEQNAAHFNLSTYTTGTYVIRLVGAKESQSFKVVKF